MKNLFLILLSMLFLMSSQANAQAVLCETGLDSFSKNIHPLLMQRCAKCHGDGGDETPHSVTDAKTAYAASEKLVDFVNIQNSRFIVKVNQKHWLNYDPTQQGMTVQEMTDALTAWWTGGENSCPSPYSAISSAVALPNPLPDRATTPDGYAVMAFDLSKLNAALPDCVLNLKIQRFTTGTGVVPGAFRVTEPSVQCSKSIHLTRVRFLINGGTEAYENLYEGVDETVPAATTTILSTDEMILIERPGVNTFQLALGTLTVLQ